MTDDSLYESLFGFLEQQQWREADEETYHLMLEICDRTSEGWFRPEDILDFPCEELRTIDGLRLYYSHQRFGFSSQRSIYQEIKETATDTEIGQKFATKVGWYKNGQWLTYPELTFHVAAPIGHFPRYVTLHIGIASDFQLEDFWGNYFFSRLVVCEENPEDWLDTIGLRNWPS